MIELEEKIYKCLHNKEYKFEYKRGFMDGICLTPEGKKAADNVFEKSRKELDEKLLEEQKHNDLLNVTISCVKCGMSLQSKGSKYNFDIIENHWKDCKGTI